MLSIYYTQEYYNTLKYCIIDKIVLDSSMITQRITLNK